VRPVRQTYAERAAGCKPALRATSRRGLW